MLINCPECGNKMSDKAQSCPHCGFEGLVVIRLVWEPTWLLADTTVAIHLDGEFLAIGSIKRGCDLTINTIPGQHVITINAQYAKPLECQVEIRDLGTYNMQVFYSRFSSKFKKEIQFARA